MFLYFSIDNHLPLTNYWSTELWLAVAGSVSVALIFLSGVYTIIIGYVVMISITVCFSLLTAYAGTLYPINCRAVATSVIVMCARLGSACGAFVIGVFLKNDCNGMFYTFAVTLSSKHVSNRLCQMPLSEKDATE